MTYNVNDLFSADAGTQDLDADLAAASVMLQKIASEEGVDLNDLSDEDVADLLGEMVGNEAEGDAGGETLQAGSEGGEDKQSSDLTYADVSAELAKVAAAENIDLTVVSREDYKAAFDAMAARMSDPSYFAEKQAAAETIETAHLIGREMAVAFMAEKRAQEEKEAGMGDRMRAIRDAMKSRGGAAWEGAKKHKKKVIAGATMAAAAGGGYAASRHMKKKSFDEAVVERAREILADNGINPDTGEKVAAADIESAAQQLLVQNGYTFEG